LLDLVGVDLRDGARLWRARDSVLERDVAITVLSAGTAMQLHATLDRTLRAGRFEHTGATRVLDVLDSQQLLSPAQQADHIGAVVAEWIPGHDLVDLVENGPVAPAVAARALAPLAAAVDAAHRAGLVLGCDHPRRIRVGTDGFARLVFHGPRADATQRDDVRGLGALLYLLLTGRWALPSGPPELPGAPTGNDGWVIPPRQLNSLVPQELSTLAVRSLAGAASGGVHTPAAVHRVLEQTYDPEEANTLLPGFARPANVVAAPTAAGTSRPAAMRAPIGKPAGGPGRDRRTRKIGIGIAVLAVVLLGAVAYGGVQVVNFVTGSNNNARSPIVVSPTATTPAPGTQRTNPAPQGAGLTGPVQLTRASVYNIADDPDNPGAVGKVIDGNTATGWKTFDYRQPFPALKPGVGIMLTLANPSSPTTAVIDSPSDGTKVEIRAATSPNPDLATTTVIGQATLAGGHTEIPLQVGQPTQYLLVWITQVPGAGGKYSSDITEVGLMRNPS
jgi:hypothetical protein